MGATGTATTQGNGNLRPFPKGKSGNPGGMPAGLRKLQATITLAHGYKVLTALQRLFEMGMDERTYVATGPDGEEVEVPVVEAKVRAQCLTAFVDKVGALTGLQSVARLPGEEQAVDEAELVERVVDGVLAKPDTRALVAAKLQVLEGGAGK
jgi:hypothetical protein